MFGFLSSLKSRPQKPSGPILVVHIPKTAGTSFREALLKDLGRKSIATDYSYKSKHTTGWVRDILYTSAGKPIRDVPLQFEMESRGASVLIGHFPCEKYSRYFRPDHVVAFVRDPLKRTVSEYLHHCRHNSLNQSFEEFIENSVRQNVLTRQLRGVSEEAFIGVTEQYDESLYRINQRFGLNLKSRRSNVAPSDATNGLIRALSRDTVRKFWALNDSDHEVFRHAVEKLNSGKL